MKKDKKSVAPELELVTNDGVEADTSFQEKQAAAELKVKDELKVQNDIIKRGMIVQMVDITYVQEETNYIMVKGKLMTDVNGIPLFTEVNMKLTKSCLAKFILEAKSLLKMMED